MSTRRTAFRPSAEALEGRLALSTANPTFAVTPGAVDTPGAVAPVTLPVSPAKFQPRHTTIFGVTVAATPPDTLNPRPVSATGASGEPLRFHPGAPSLPGRNPGARAYVRNGSPGPFTLDVTGRHGTTGPFLAGADLPGDINGDGKVDFTDLQLFGQAFPSKIGVPAAKTTGSGSGSGTGTGTGTGGNTGTGTGGTGNSAGGTGSNTGPNPAPASPGAGQKAYDPAADFNHNGQVGQDDGRLLVRNITPLTPKIPIRIDLKLGPGQAVKHNHSGVSGAYTNDRTVTIIGHTTPGSIVFSDNGQGDYRFNKSALATDAKGMFSEQVTLTDGINNFEYLVFDPYGQQKIRAFPIFWGGFAAYEAQHPKKT